MANAAYWKKRFALLEESQNRTGQQCYREIETQYRKAQKEIEKQLSHWYYRLAQNNGISMQEARKMLTKRELEEFKWDVNEYIRYGKANAVSGAWEQKLENASARYHISRLEAIKIHTQQHLEVLFGNQSDIIDSAMKEAYTSGYYHAAYEIQKGIGVGWNFATLDERKIEKVIKKPWAADGKNFSERIWNNREKLVNEVHSAITQNIILGQDPQKAIDVIAKKMKVSKSNAGRLVMTEEAFFSSAAQKDCFSELGVEQFEVLATLDSHTSEICQKMDGQHFPMSQWEVGVTAPPFHVRCRTVTIPYFDDDFDLPGKRAARGEDGKTYYVPADMTYEEWKESLADEEEDIHMTDMEDSQEYRPVSRSSETENIMRGSKEIAIRKVVNSAYKGGIHISDSVKLKPKQMHNIEKSINEALKVVGDDGNLPRCMIISSAEMQTNAVCSYKAETNILYINSIIGDVNKLLELQKDMACPNNPLSTYVHELIHWKDAEEYRKNRVIENQNEYLKYLRAKCKKKLDRLQKQGYNISQISKYASDKYVREAYDETMTEYRVLRFLEKR